jgi:hypothetical protein
LVFYTVSPILGLSSDFGWSDEFQWRRPQRWSALLTTSDWGLSAYAVNVIPSWSPGWGSQFVEFSPTPFHIVLSGRKSGCTADTSGAALWIPFLLLLHSTAATCIICNSTQVIFFLESQQQEFKARAHPALSVQKTTNSARLGTSNSP